LFRSAQEALTNVGKHARASRVDVRLEWRGGQVVLRVADDGTPRGEAGLAGGGNGLRGMRERAELVGGKVEAGPTADGFTVELRLPA
jgi:signal transduction histidine kinase